MEDRAREEELFQLVKGTLTGRSPIPVIVLLGEIKEGAGDGGVVRDELTIEVGKAKERSHILDFGQGQPGGDTIEYNRVHDELTRFYNHSKIFDLWDIKLAFLELQVKVEFCHTLEDMTGSLCMGLRVRGGNEEVVHVDDESSLSDHVSEGVVHESLEHGRRVAETKEHDGWFKESFVSDESCLPLVTILDLDVVIPSSNIELGEVVGVFQLVHKIGDERNGVGVIGGVFVEVVIILAGAKFSILLFDKEEGGCLEGVGEADFPCC